MIIDSCNYLAAFRLCSMRGGVEDKKDKKDKLSFYKTLITLIFTNL